MFNSGISSKDDIDRFWTKVNKTIDCWFWTSNNRGGYGLFKYKKVNWQAHRIAYELTFGIIPPFFDIHHKCHNKLCVNPSHLEAVTEANHPDAAPTLNRNKTHCPKGHEYTIQNTKTNKKGYRWCIECSRLNAQYVNEQRRIKAKTLGISVRKMLGRLYCDGYS